MRLVEGMRSGDLEDLVLPLISVDEYESKVDDDAIVVGFYVGDHDAAHDLNRFIQKSPVMILDTDVSPAPDQRGYYLVFFEVLNNDRLAESICDMLEEVGPLAHIEKWQMQLRGMDDVATVEADALTRHFRDNDKKKTQDTAKMDESVMRFLQPSALERILPIDGGLVFEGYDYRDNYDIIAFGPLDRIVTNPSFSISADDVGFSAAASASRLNRQLGEGWSVSKLGGFNLITCATSQEALLLRSRGS